MIRERKKTITMLATVAPHFILQQAQEVCSRLTPTRRSTEKTAPSFRQSSRSSSHKRYPLTPDPRYPRRAEFFLSLQQEAAASVPQTERYPLVHSVSTLDNELSSRASRGSLVDCSKSRRSLGYRHCGSSALCSDAGALRNLVEPPTIL